ncbi:MAG TPA: FG-GAP-like repeat-containing protein [Pyrinomonadaceae bacterium]
MKFKPERFMQTKTAFSKTTALGATFNSKPKGKKVFCAILTLIFALSLSAIWLANGVSSQAEERKSLRGDDAVNKLKQNGQYDSLMDAMKAARRDERGRNDSDSFNAPEAMPPTAKLYAPDGAPANFFGYSVALSGETAIVGVPLDSLESINPASVSEGSAYIFTRSGTAWTLQQKLTASDAANRDYFGANVSIDGDTAVVGALFDDVGASVNQGSAYVFTRSGTVWTQQAKLTATQGAAGDRFGVSVEISGETVVVGTKRDQGAAYVFTRSGATWTQQQQLTPSNGAAGDEFGGSVAINGETILVSATGRPVSGADNQGAVYVFTRAGGVWSEQQILTAVDGAAGDRFGSDVAIKDGAAIVGAYFDDIGGNVDQGSAYIFTRSGSVWTEQAKLLAADGVAGDHFGSSVALGGNTAVVGAPDNDFPGVLSDIHVDAGSAYVFTGSGTMWTQQSQLSQDNVGGSFGDGARFGASVSISGETVLVGIPGADNEDGFAGVYVRANGAWSLQAFLADDEDSSGDEFGYSVAIDGDTAVVGAPYDDLGASREQGSAYVFVRSAATNTWSFQAKLTASDGVSGIAFGSDVSISGNTIVVGTGIVFVSFTTSVNAEAAYVFVRSGETWTQQQKLTPTDGAPGEAFGSTVSISGETIVVGAPFHFTPDRGAAYVFARAGGAWSQQQKLSAANPGQNDTHYGYSVAVSGETIIVGAPRYGNGGQIHAYVRTGTAPNVWILQQIISANDTNNCDGLGIEVALSGNTLIASTNRGLYTGAGCTIQNGYSVYIFARSGIIWSRQQKLHDSRVPVSDVAINGDTAVFGTTEDSAININQTGARVFTRTGTSWTPREPLITDANGTNSGAADVAVFGSTVIVGATEDELDLSVNQDVDFTSHQGSAYVFNIPDAQACGFTLNPTSQAFTSAGGSGSFTVTTSSPNCPWLADSDSPWITVTSATSGTGNATISFSVAANPTSNPRTGTINVGGQIFTVTQAGIIGSIFTVMNTNDSGAGSLRNAIAQAVMTTESRTIVFDQAAFNTPQTITLATNLLMNSNNGGTITIYGPGANLLTITGNGATRIFTIGSNTVVSISGMTLTGGNGTGDVSSGNGGAIYNSADLTLNDVVVNANATTGGAGNFGGGIYATIRPIRLNNCVVSNNTTAGRGGGIYVDSNVTATVSATTVSNNTSNGFGGGIYSSAFATLTLTGSNVTGNTTNISLATDGGGGIFTAGTTFNMTDSSVSGNRAVNGSGGGISFSNSGTNTITRSTVSHNTAGVNGGGINFSNTQLNVTNSTISHNRANGNGGGINRNNTTPATQVFRYTTIAFNTAGNTGGGVNTQAAIPFNNTIVGANSAQTSPDYAGALNSGGYNLIKDTTGTIISGTTTGNITGVDPRLDGVLRDNGGLTRTLALRPSSPAIDAANPADFPATDQRGSPRPVDGDGDGGARSDIGAYERQANALVAAALFDFDGDGRSDLSVFRPSQGTWYYNASSNNQLSGAQFGLATDRLAPADYDGDGKTDIAVWRDEPSNPDKANFYILQSSNSTFRGAQFGRTGDNPKVVGDWDGDGKADLAVYRNGSNNGQSYFFYRPSSQPTVDFVTVYWGIGGDSPVRGDYDGDGRLDAAVYRPSNATWYILQSSNSQQRYEQWGVPTDKFVPADYDGDAKTDLAVFRDGTWYIKQSSNNQQRFENFGLGSDTPVPADYDGDGRADIAVFRNGIWYLRQSTGGFAAPQFGLSTDVPVPSAYINP